MDIDEHSEKSSESDSQINDHSKSKKISKNFKRVNVYKNAKKRKPMILVFLKLKKLILIHIL